MINFGPLIFGTISLVVVTVIIQTLRLLITNVFSKQLSKKDKKRTKKLFNKGNLIIAVLGFLVIFFIFATNPMIHNGSQEVVGDGVVQQEARQLDEETVSKEIELSTERVKKVEQDNLTEINEVDKNSADAYNNFLKQLEN